MDEKKVQHLHQEGHDGGQQLEAALVHLANVAVQNAHLHNHTTRRGQPKALFLG